MPKASAAGIWAAAGKQASAAAIAASANIRRMLLTGELIIGDNVFHLLYRRLERRFGNNRYAANRQNQHKNQTSQREAHFYSFPGGIGNRPRSMLSSRL